MQNRTTKELFDLVKGMSKWEKKSFHRYARRNSNSESLKVLSLFSVLNAMEAYSEKAFAQKTKGMQCRQLPSLKVYLYNQILDSLRVCKNEDSLLLQLHQLMDHANILYSKGFWAQALKVLKRLKKTAAAYHQVSFLFQALSLQRKLELLCGTCSAEQVGELSNELAECSQQLSLISHLSNQSMLLYGCFRRCGPLQTEEEKRRAGEIYWLCCEVEDERLSFYARLYFLQAKTYYYQLTNDAAQFSQSASEWVDHFDQNRQMLKVEPLQYQRGLFYLNEAAFLHKQKDTLHRTAGLLEESNDPFYQLSAALNLCLFEKAAGNDLLDEAYRHIQSPGNPSRLLKICCQAARLCFQVANYERSLDFIFVGLQQKTEVRIDLQYELRLLQLAAHKELGHDRLVESLELSARRFAKTYKLVAAVEKEQPLTKYFGTASST